ncbi:hypothetical protein D6C99_09883, partial [Aureobasidium pullulans]
MATASPPRRLNRLKAFFLCSKDSEELSMPEKPALQIRQAPVARVQPASLPTLPNQNGAKDKTQFAPDSSKASPGDSGNTALEKAIKDHIQTLSESDRLAFTNASTIDVDVLLESVRKANHEHVQASSFRPYTTKVTNFLNVLQLSVGAASTIAQSEPVSSIALGGAKLVISLAVRYLEYFDKLANMLDQLSKYLPPLARYSEKCHLPNICDALANVYADILNFYSAARRVFVDDANRSKEFASLKAFFKSQWKPFEAEFGEIKSSLEYHNNVLLHSGVSEILVNSSKEKEEFLRWLSTSNFELRKSKSLEARHVGTCDWLFSTFEFKKWLSSNTSELMWCHGKPGSGKSILASQ